MTAVDVTAELPSRLFHLGVEVVIFILIECVTRLTVPKNSGVNGTSRSLSKAHKIKLLSAQAILLVLSSFLCAALHHVPYILAIVTVFVVGRLVTSSIRNRHSSQIISKPLRSTPENEDDSVVHPLPSIYNHEDLRLRTLAHIQPAQQPPFHSASASKVDPPTARINSYLKEQSVSSNAFITYRSQPERAPQGLRRDDSSLHFHSNNRVTQSLASQQFLSKRKSTQSPLQRAALTATQSNRQQPSSLLNFCHVGPSYISSFLDYKLPSKTPPGLTNPGNTCFINSTLQCLAWTEGFLEVVPLLNPASEDPSLADFLKALNTTLHQCHVIPDGVSRFKTIDTSPLLSAMSNVVPYLVSPPGVGVYQSQQDAAEFLLWLLDQLHGTLRNQTGGLSGLSERLNSIKIEQLRKTRNDCVVSLERAHSDHILTLREPLVQLSDVDWSLHWQEYCSTVYNLFLGQLIEARECQQCKKVSVNVEYFTVLSLPVLNEGQGYSIDDSFSRFSEVEDLTLSNMLHCSCNTVHKDALAPGKRLALLSKPPQKLIIQLTRYSYDSVHNEGVKNTASVSFPLALSLLPHTMNAKLDINSEPNSHCYKLCAFCIHTGAMSTSFGHYIAYALASNGKWYSFNDDRVCAVDSIESELATSFVRQNAYMLFYIKNT